jgi:hypothetical protein
MVHLGATVVDLLVILIAERNPYQEVFHAVFLKMPDDAVGLIKRQFEHFEKRGSHDNAVRQVKTTLLLQRHSTLAQSHSYLHLVGNWLIYFFPNCF